MKNIETLKIPYEKIPCGFTSIIVKSVGATGAVIYYYLLEHTNGDNTCFPSIKEMVSNLGLSDKTVTKSINSLAKMGFITVKYRKWDSNFYTVTDPFEILQIVKTTIPSTPRIVKTTIPEKGRIVKTTTDESYNLPPNYTVLDSSTPEGVEQNYTEKYNTACAHAREEDPFSVEDYTGEEWIPDDEYVLPDLEYESDLPLGATESDSIEPDFSDCSDQATEDQPSSMQPEEFGFVSPVANNNHLPPVALTPLQDQENEMAGYNTKLQFKEYVEKLMGPYLLHMYPVATKDFVDPNKVEKLLASGKIDQTIKALEHEANSGHHPEWKISDYEIGVANMTKLTKVFNMFLETPEDIFYRKFDKWQQRQVA